MKLIRWAILGFMVALGLVFYDEVVIIIDLIVENAKQIASTMAGLISVLSILTVIKIRIIDPRFHVKLQKVYGKQMFNDALVVVNEMLNAGYSIEETIKKILLVNQLEIDMRLAINDLRSIINPELALIPKISLSKRENKKLKREINKLLQLLDKRLEIHYIAKDINITNREKINRVKILLDKDHEKINNFNERRIKKGKKQIVDAFNQGLD